MNSKEKQIVRQLYDEIINKAQFDKLGDVLDQEIIWHDPLLRNGEVRGIENFEDVLAMIRSAFPDLHITVEDMIQEGKKVVTRFTIRGTHKGDLMGLRQPERSLVFRESASSGSTIGKQSKNG